VTNVERTRATARGGRRFRSGGGGGGGGDGGGCGGDGGGDDGGGGRVDDGIAVVVVAAAATVCGLQNTARHLKMAAGRRREATTAERATRAKFKTVHAQNKTSPAK